MRKRIAMAFALAMICGGVRTLQAGTPATAQQKPSAMQQKPSAANHETRTAKKELGTAKKVSRKRRLTARKSAHIPAAPQVPAQVMPPVPATLMNSAPVKPQVTMEGGLLTIDAPNSTLGDVLSGIHEATGASIEGVAPSERVAVKLGPGNPRQVIGALLHGTPYDYVILGAPDKPDAVTRVLLSESSGGNEAPEVQNTGSRNGFHPMPPNNPPEPENTGEDTSAQPEPVPAPQPVPPPQAQNQPEQNQQDQNQNQPKSQDQLYRQLQNLGLAPVSPQPQPQQPPQE